MGFSDLERAVRLVLLRVRRAFEARLAGIAASTVIREEADKPRISGDAFGERFALERIEGEGVTNKFHRADSAPQTPTRRVR